MIDSILCHDKADAHNVIDVIGGKHIEGFEYLDNGKVRILLDCSVSELITHKDTSPLGYNPYQE